MLKGKIRNGKDKLRKGFQQNRMILVAGLMYIGIIVCNTW